MVEWQRLPATLSAQSGRDVTVDLGFGGTADGGGTDYNISTTQIVISAGSLTGTSIVTAVDDALDEIGETVVVDIIGVTNGAESGTQQQSTTITDDDPEPMVSLTVDNADIAENGGVATFTATLSSVSGRDVTVDLGFGGTATGAGTDYNASTTQIVISAGSLTGTSIVTAVDDALDEVGETVVVDITGVTNAAENGLQQQSTTILDNDPPPTVTLSGTPPAIAEDGGVATLTATLSAISSLDVTVDLQASGDAAGGGVDYSLSATQIVITAGDLTGTATITAVQDALAEVNEVVIVDISAVTNGTENAQQQVTTTITDDDGIPTVDLSVDNATIAENGGLATVTATLSDVSGQDVTVNLQYSGSALGGGTDYNAPTTQIVIAAGSLTGTATITAVDDALDEDDEDVVVDITGVTNANENGTQQVTTTINDDDPEPTVNLSVDNASVAENSGVATFTATLSAVSGRDVSVDLGFAGTAVGGGSDYNTSTTQIVISAGSLTGTSVVTAVDDALDEVSETVVVDIIGVTNAAENGVQQQMTSITDDDPEPTVSLSVDNASIAENSGVATFTATLSAVSGRDVSVDLGFAGTASGGGTDYDTSTTQIVISAGSLTGTSVVTAVDDALDEVSETVVVDIIGVTNAAENGIQQQMTTVTDDDPEPTVSLSVDKRQHC